MHKYVCSTAWDRRPGPAKSCFDQPRRVVSPLVRSKMPLRRVVDRTLSLKAVARLPSEVITGRVSSSICDLPRDPPGLEVKITTIRTTDATKSGYGPQVAVDALLLRTN